MRTVYWLFVVSVALFISGIAFIVAGARTTQASPVEVRVETTPVASIKQIMNAIVMPDAYVIYNAVGTKSSATGVEEIAPKNDEEWAAVANAAAAVIESGNLLLMGNRLLDKGDWIKMTREFMKQATLALKAAEAKDTNGIVAAGGDLNTTCDNCHAKYQRQ